MRNVKWILVLLVVCSACARRATLPGFSRYNVTALRNDSNWFATGKAIRLVTPTDEANAVKQFNLQIVTDIDFRGNGSATKSPVVTGCINDCIPTQRLHIYNIPLKKGKYKLAKLDKRRIIETERANYWLLIDGGGVYENYQFRANAPGWVRITAYNRPSNTLEGQFRFSLDANRNITAGPAVSDKTPSVARFSRGLFRVKLVDVKLTE